MKNITPVKLKEKNVKLEHNKETIWEGKSNIMDKIRDIKEVRTMDKGTKIKQQEREKEQKRESGRINRQTHRQTNVPKTEGYNRIMRNTEWKQKSEKRDMERKIERKKWRRRREGGKGDAIRATHVGTDRHDSRNEVNKDHIKGRGRKEQRMTNFTRGTNEVKEGRGE